MKTRMQCKCSSVPYLLPKVPPSADRARGAARPDAMFTGVASKAPSTVEVLEEVQPGDGKRFPKTGDKVVVHYTGSLRSAAPEAPGCSSDHRVRAVSQE